MGIERKVLFGIVTSLSSPRLVAERFRAMLPDGSGRRLLHSAPGERARQAPGYHKPAESA